MKKFGDISIIKSAEFNSLIWMTGSHRREKAMKSRQLMVFDKKTIAEDEVVTLNIITLQRTGIEVSYKSVLFMHKVSAIPFGIQSFVDNKTPKWSLIYQSSIEIRERIVDQRGRRHKINN